MTDLTLAPRADALLARMEAWSARSLARSLAVKAAVTVAGPLVVLTGVAMLVLPGPGLVVIALGLALLAVEYPWARQALALLGRALARAKQATLPTGASGPRRLLGVAAIAGVLVAGFLATTAVTALLGSLALL